MIPQRTDRVLTCYRIGDPTGEYPIYSPRGAELFPGRWHITPDPVIYTSEHFSTAVLEKLVHAYGPLPVNQHYVTITIPPQTSYEVVTEARCPNWADRQSDDSQRYGHDWFVQSRSAILIVPSLPARIERNFIINLAHPDAQHITHSLHEPITWDQRLFPVRRRRKPA